MKDQYIQAVISLLLEENNPDTVFSRLLLTLQKRGHERLHSRILRGVYETLLRKVKGSNPVVVVARHFEVALLETQIKKIVTRFGAEEIEYEVEVDPTIIGGFTASYQGKFADRSFKKQLMHLYRSIVTH